MEAGPEKHVVLIKAAKSPEDAYKKALQQADFSVHFVKALHFEYVNAEGLVSALQTQHGGLIVTSQTSVESIIHAISISKGAGDVVNQWNDVPAFVVGKATAAAVAKLGLKSTGATSGNAELLAEEIIKFYSDREKSMVAPLLFPCGNLAQETLPLKLEGVGLRVNRIVCYNTTRDSSIEQSLHILKQQGVLRAQCRVVFFSPSGVQFVLPLLQSYCDVKTLQVIAIGPTTGEALWSAGLSPVIAHTPSPQALLDAMQ